MAKASVEAVSKARNSKCIIVNCEKQGLEGRVTVARSS
jgi:hypothetical protein